ncbi:MAG: ACT domain-containing protein [Gammaproteobacteria bacterium]|nr:ACT domain-containing protein [Gammaproteobacteria bacterium]MCP5459980.1 ACT domain-containing protein [Gammaproteobacteria bacterium]
MNTALVLTLIGDDRPGLVDAVSATIAEHGGNWQESRMAQLAGKFAGILLAEVADSQVEALTADLRRLQTQGLNVTVERSDQSAKESTYRSLHLNLVGQDHPGIVRDVSHVLASRGINIEELSTECSSASWSGETLFHATAHLQVPRELSSDELREVLEGLANELMVDIALDDAPLAAADT